MGAVRKRDVLGSVPTNLFVGAVGKRYLHLSARVADLLLPVAKLKHFFTVRVGVMPGLGLGVEVLDQPLAAGMHLLDIPVVVEDPCRLAVRTQLLPVAVRITNLLSAVGIRLFGDGAL